VGFVEWDQESLCSQLVLSSRQQASLQNHHLSLSNLGYIREQKKRQFYCSTSVCLQITKMRLSWFFSAVVGAMTANALPTITATGNKFFTSEGKQFFMKGMATPRAGLVGASVLTVRQASRISLHQVGSDAILVPSPASYLSNMQQMIHSLTLSNVLGTLH
jgi:hypothetical protein